MSRILCTLRPIRTLWISGLLLTGCGTSSERGAADGNHLSIQLSGLSRTSRLRVQLLDGLLQPVAYFETETEVTGEQVLLVSDQAQLREGAPPVSFARERVRCVQVRTLDEGPVLSGRVPVRWEMGSVPVALAPPSEMVGLSSRTDIQLPVSNRIALADLNGDQRADLIIGNSQSAGLSVLRGDGKGGFSTEPIPASEAAESITAADVNGDGKLDLVFSSAVTGEGLWVVPQENTGVRFLTPVKMAGTAYGGSVVTAFAIANFGTAELPSLRLALTHTGMVPKVLSVSSLLEATSIQTLPMWLEANPVSQMSFRDLNADGALDLAMSISSQDVNNLVLGLNSGGMFPAVPTESIKFNSAVAAFALADVNSDGRIDVLAALNQKDAMPDTRVGRLLRNRSGALAGPSYLGNFPARTRAVVVADFNGDLDPDLAVIGYSGSTLDIRRGSGTGGFSGSSVLSSPVPLASSPYQMVVGDFNQDCKPDVAISFESNSPIVFLTSH